MYVAVVSIIVGQALLFSNVQVLEYGAAAWRVAHLFVLAYEEPKMRSTFPEEYQLYRANVPRWIPRLTPWRPWRTHSCVPRRHSWRRLGVKIQHQHWASNNRPI